MFTFPNQFSRGAFLIELMMALALSLLSLILLVTIYSANQKTYQFQANLIRLQKQAIAALHFLSADIKKAGYIGCAKLSVDFPVTAFAGYSLTKANQLVGSDNEIMTKHMGYPNVILLKEMVLPNELYVTDELHLKSGNIAIISDCKKAEIFQIKSSSTYQHVQKLFTSSPLHNHFSVNAEIGYLESNHYYLAPMKVKNNNSDHYYSLYLENYREGKVELVEGISKLQFQYTSKDYSEDLLAKEVKDWSMVQAVAIQVEVASKKLIKKWYDYVSFE